MIFRSVHYLKSFNALLPACMSDYSEIILNYKKLLEFTRFNHTLKSNGNICWKVSLRWSKWSENLSQFIKPQLYRSIWIWIYGNKIFLFYYERLTFAFVNLSSHFNVLETIYHTRSPSINNTLIKLSILHITTHTQIYVPIVLLFIKIHLILFIIMIFQTHSTL